jgi:hypothetical protein
MSVTAYKIGVEIALVNSVSAGLAVISRDLLGLNTSIKQIEQSFGRWAVAAGGVASILGGSVMLGAMGKLVQHGRELVHQQELMRISGLDNQEIAAATAKSYEVSARVQTTTISENLRHIRELRMALGSTELAEENLEAVSKADAVLNSIKGGSKDQVWQLVKSLELHGDAQDKEKFLSMLDTFTKAEIASGGKVDPSQFFMAFKYGRTAMLGWDDTFIGQYLPRSIQSMSGGGGSGSGTGGPGNAIMSAFQAVVRGQMPKKAAGEFERLGLADVQHIEGSSQSTLGPVKGRDLFIHNPYEWVQSVLMPALLARGITKKEDILAEVGQLFPNRTAGQIVSEWALQGRAYAGAASNFEKDAAQARMALGNQPSFESLRAHDPTVIMEAFHKQWTALLEALGSPMVAPAMSAMRSITDLMTSITQFSGAHPDAIRRTGEGLAIVAAGLIALGGTAVVTAVAMAAPFAAAIGLIAGAVTVVAGLAVVNWDAIKAGASSVVSAFDAIGAAINSFVSSIAAIPGKIKSLLPSFGGAPAVDDLGGIGTGGKLGTEGAHGAIGPDGIPGAAGQKQSWNVIPPPRNQTPIVLSSTLNLDGRTLADQMSEHLASLFEHPISAPASNGLAYYTSPDSGWSTT